MNSRMKAALYRLRFGQNTSHKHIRHALALLALFAALSVVGWQLPSLGSAVLAYSSAAIKAVRSAFAGTNLKATTGEAGKSAAVRSPASLSANPLALFTGTGVAPTGDPGTGFEIEGSLQANTPTPNTTDWVPGAAGTGVGVLTAAGVPVDPSKTWHSVDAYDSQSDDTFESGLKYVDDPNTWTWTHKKATAKLDLNNGLLHISTDGSGNLWAVVGGDRLSTNGNSYLDFEFLQNTMTANANGTFSSAGPNGGRTIGDLDLTLELTNGGSQPTFFIQRWEADGSVPLGFTYHTIAAPAATHFESSNVGGTVPVSFGAFGSFTYDQFAFAEGAVNISALIQNLDPCLSIKTVFFKTKSSQAPNANLDDFIQPIQLNIGLAPTANAGADQALCLDPDGTTNFTNVGVSVTNGTASWSIVGTPTGTITAGDVQIVSPNSATTNVNILNSKTGSVTLRLTSTSNQNPPCTPATDDVTLTVNNGAVAMAGPDQTLCQGMNGTTVFTLNGVVTAGSATPLWSIFSVSGGITNGDVTIVSPNSPTTDVNVANSKIGTVTLQLTSSVRSCPPDATDLVALTVNPNPTASAGADQTLCQAASGTTNFSVTGTFNNATLATPAWVVASVSGTIAVGDVNIVSPNSATTAVNIAAGKTGSVTLNFTVASNQQPSCGNTTDDVILTVNPLPTADAGADQTLCQAASGTTNFSVTGTFANATLSTPAWSIGSVSGGLATGDVTIVSPNSATTAVNIAAGKTGSVTLNFTVASNQQPSCGTKTDGVILTVNPLATVNAGTDQTVCACFPVQLAGTIGGGATSATWSGGTGTFSQNANTLNAIYTPSAAEKAAATPITLTLTTNDPAGPCNAASDTVVISFTQCADLSVSMSVSPPQANPGSTVIFTVSLNNAGPNTATGVAVSDPLPAGFTCVSGTASQGTYSCGTGIWTVGNVNVAQTLTLQITATVNGTGPYTNTAQVSASAQCDPDSTPNNNAAEDDLASVQLVVNPVVSELSDQKAGSLLFYSLYTSSSAAPASQNTRISITNTNQTDTIGVHLYFVDGATCSVADAFICLTGNQTASFLASDFDPGTTGYLVAVASDRVTGCPANFNFLIGDAYVKFSTGHAADLGAEAFEALSPTPVACNASSITAELAFNGTTGYNRAPRVLASSSIPSRADGNDTLIVLDRVGGSLATGAATLGSIFGILYDDAENPLSFTFTAGVCQFRSSLSNNFPRTAPRFEQFIPAGRNGWAKFYSLADIGLLGAQLNFNPSAGTSASAFNQGHNLHKLTLTSAATLTIPIFPPNC